MSNKMVMQFVAIDQNMIFYEARKIEKRYLSLTSFVKGTY